MVTFLAFTDGEPFATGFIEYNYQPATEHELEPRIMFQVAIENRRVTAILDTGAPYVVCNPSLTRELGLLPVLALTQMRLLIRGVSVTGRLYRLNLTFLATQGNDLTVETTAFVPDPEWEERWGNLPSFIGLNGCLERMRFAVDPGSDTFYFGSL